MTLLSHVDRRQRLGSLEKGLVEAGEDVTLQLRDREQALVSVANYLFIFFTTKNVTTRFCNLHAFIILLKSVIKSLWDQIGSLLENHLQMNIQLNAHFESAVTTSMFLK